MARFTGDEIEAIRRLENNENFRMFIKYLQRDCEDAKDKLLLARDTDFSVIQGQGQYVKNLLKDINSTFKKQG